MPCHGVKNPSPNAQTHHSLLRSVLKTYHKTPKTQRNTHLPSILQTLNNYIPYLFAISRGLDGKTVRGEEIDVVLKREIESEWKSILADDGVVRLPIGKGGTGRGKKGRVRLKGIDAEICFVLTTLATIQRLIAREQLRSIYTSGNAFPEREERTKAVSAAMKGLLGANGVHVYLSRLCADDASPTEGGPPETSSGVQHGLAELAMAEATLLAVLKDDPYPAVVMQSRDKNDKEWMVKAPEIPKVRAHLFARLCIAAGEHAGRAEALFQSSAADGRERMKVDEDIIEYARDLRKTARTKACRFFGIDEELGGEMGRGIAWLRGARRELGGSGVVEEEGKGWKKGWGKWAVDAGRMEEGRVLEMLERKWVKVNDTINTQLIPPFEPLLAGMPSGREIHSSTMYVPPELDADVLERMRAPPDPDDARALMDEDDNSEDEAPAEGSLPGAFPNRVAGGPGTNEYY
ncbi:MAG: hypothetical protein Q9166_003642 [cf. Caloplaca sp. 2 TL-2023]